MDPTSFSMETSLRRLAMLEPAYSLTPDLPEIGWATRQTMILWADWMHFTSGWRSGSDGLLTRRQPALWLGKPVIWQPKIAGSPLPVCFSSGC